MGMIDERPIGIGLKALAGPLTRRGAPALWGYIDEVKSRFRCNVQTLTGDYLENVLLPGGSVIDAEAKGRLAEFREGQRVLIDFVGGSPENPVVVNWYPTPGQEKHSRDLEQFEQSPDSGSFVGAGDSEDFADFHPSGWSVRYKDEEYVIKKGTETVFKIDFSSDEITIKTDKVRIEGDLDVTGEVTWKKGTPEEMPASKHGHLKASFPGPASKPMQVGS